MKALLLATVIPLLAACAHDPGTTVSAAGLSGEGANPATAATDAALEAAIAGAWRDPANVARDAYRHPAQTLRFFGVTPSSRVIEITPGGGWYTEILAPYLRERGHLVAALAVAGPAQSEGTRNYLAKGNANFRAKLAADPSRYDTVEVREFSVPQPTLGADGSADVVLTFRNVHNWTGWGSDQAMFDAFFRVLKPGGVLGVVDHRARPGTSIEAMKKSGYLTEAHVLELAQRAGFVLEERSEVNANPRDSADYPNGVWTLPPSNRHDPEDAQMYRSIGESDRMTLRFRKSARD
ncbi:class I SAM-dependent methyltransferase [Aerolutibacter ruishenii]|uniref:Putative methyltransferase n=1 Tax=Aerolutibacter ruishenii TaxID=686800 RepID=A0A562M0K3_9GAMM|nr:class I SAM-dependent methyltransferase [Lysobacter ruishenii]TWI13410.1 putative methyltransferase [Lysobacter ruishenii]